MTATKPTTAEKITAYCKLFHHGFNEDDIQVFAETRRHGIRWVGYLECPRCGTKRTTVMMPKSREICYHEYEPGPNYITDMTQAEARVIVFPAPKAVGGTKTGRKAAA